MARKKQTNVKKLSDEEIVIEINETRRKLFDLRCQKVTEKIEDTSQFGKIKKTIARLITEKNAREKAAEVTSS